MEVAPATPPHKTGEPPEDTVAKNLCLLTMVSSDTRFDYVRSKSGNVAKEILFEKTKAGDATAAKLGEKALSDGTAIDGSVHPDMVVPMGEIKFLPAKEGDKASSGMTRKNSMPEARAEREHGELMAVKTSETAENVSEKKVLVENPTM